MMKFVVKSFNLALDPKISFCVLKANWCTDRKIKVLCIGIAVWQ